MRARRWTALRTAALAGLGAIAVTQMTGTAFSFTQGVQHGQMLVPMGHEWITRMGAIELLGNDRWLKPDPKDPRIGWPSTARATETSLAGAEKVVQSITGSVIARNKDNRFAAIYSVVQDAILGERWVDIGGINFAESKVEGKFGKANCLDAVTQEAPDVQYDHFMRKPSDIDGRGGVDAARESSKRFVEYFVNAALAKEGTMPIWDGGAWSDAYQVNRQFFMFGRALHLFEDSFSPDHTVRIAADYYRRVRQVKSYLCAAGSEQHAHLSPLDGSAFYQTGDVIWVSSWNGKAGAEDWSAYTPSNMRGYALAATEGTKEVWAAFIRTLAVARPQREAAARAEATKVAQKWMGFDEAEMLGWYGSAEARGTTYVQSTKKSEDGGIGTTVAQCMARDWKGTSQAKKLAEFAEQRRLCTYNMVPAAPGVDIDRSLHLAYDWRWRHALYLEAPPSDWNPGQPQMVEVELNIANRLNNQYMRREGDWVYNDAPNTPKKATDILTFVSSIDPLIPLEQNSVTFRVGPKKDNKFISRAADSWGRIGIYSGDSMGHFSIVPRPDGYYSLHNIDDKQYVYMYSDQKAYINRDGKPENTNAQWRVNGLPGRSLVTGEFKIGFAGKLNRLVQDAAGQLVVAKYQGLGAQSVSLFRQDDGSFMIAFVAGVSRKYVVAAPDGSGFSSHPKIGTKFQLEPTQNRDAFNIRDDAGRYWYGDPTKPSTFLEPVDAPGAECDWDPCDGPVILGDLSGKGGRAKMLDKVLPPVCRDRPPQVCKLPVEISLVPVMPTGR